MERKLLDFLQEQCGYEKLEFENDKELLEAVVPTRYRRNLRYEKIKEYLDARETINKYFPMLFEYYLEVGTHGSDKPMTVMINVDDEDGGDIRFLLSELPKQKEKIIPFILKIVYDEGIRTGKHKEKIEVGKFLRKYSELAKHL